jgi:exonuclease III
MADYYLPTTKPCKRMGIVQTKLKFIQLNLQNSRLATDNIRKIIEEGNMDFLCIQEPHTMRSKIAGLPKNFKIFTSGEGKHLAAIIVKNNEIDTMLIKQLSDEDAVGLEVKTRNKKIIITSMYFDIKRQINIDLLKIEAIIQYANDAGVIIAMDSNSRSTSWHDILTNSRGEYWKNL